MIFNIISHIISLLSFMFFKIFNNKNIKINSKRFYKSRINFFKNVDIKGKKAKLIFNGNCSLKKNTLLLLNNGTIELENNVRINYNTIIASHKMIKIGENTLIGPNCCLYDHNHSFDANGISLEKYKEGTIIIGKNVWIGANVTILKDTVIGDNTIIGAGTVVKGVIPERAIVTSERNLKIDKIREEGKEDEKNNIK